MTFTLVNVKLSINCATHTTLAAGEGLKVEHSLAGASYDLRLPPTIIDALMIPNSSSIYVCISIVSLGMSRSTPASLAKRTVGVPG